ncbi:MAG: hypothetical protein KBT44_03690 [Bacteroidales bacterium]|nr:hypothetical protein [Candidatus Equibacterium intestinale]
MKHLYIILLIVAVTVLTGCPERIKNNSLVIIYNCLINEVETGGTLPQEGSEVKIPVSYALATTKFSPAVHRQSFRYRAMIDGVQYSYAENPRYVVFDRENIETENCIIVPVPENDSYTPRTVTIDVSLGASLDGESEWTEWRCVYSGTQEALQEGEAQRLQGIDTWKVFLLFDGVSLEFDLSGDDSSRCLKALLLDGDLMTNIGVANNLIETAYGEDAEALMEHVPLNHVTYTSFKRGDIFMTDLGTLRIENESRKKGISGRDTYIGKISDSSLDDLNTICYSEKYFGLDTYPMTIHLVK